MKTRQLDRKLVLNKKSIANIGVQEMKDAKGKGLDTYFCSDWVVSRCVLATVCFPQTFEWACNHPDG